MLRALRFAVLIYDILKADHESVLLVSRKESMYRRIR